MFEVLGFYKFIKIKSLQKNKILLQDFLIKKNIKGTIILANEGINGTISGQFSPNSLVAYVGWGTKLEHKRKKVVMRISQLRICSTKGLTLA